MRHMTCATFHFNLKSDGHSGRPIGVTLTCSVSLFQLPSFWVTFQKWALLALDPSFDIGEGSFPIASAIDVWVRDPPAVSALPARGA